MTGGGIVHDSYPSGATSAGLRESLEAEESTELRPSGSDQGDLVITYEDFLGFLLSKHPAVQQTCLAFKGRNAVLFVADYVIESKAEN